MAQSRLYGWLISGQRVPCSGLNNTTLENLQEAWATGVRFHTLQIRYSMFSWRYVESNIIPWCAEHGVGILAHSTLGKGLLTGRYKPGHKWSPDDERSNMVDFHGDKFARFCDAVEKLTVIANRKGATMVELATGWVLRHPEVAVALVGGKTPQQVEANTRYVNDLTAEDLAEIQAILDAAPYGKQFISSCTRAHKTVTCPSNEASRPTVMSFGWSTIIV